MNECDQSFGQGSVLIFTRAKNPIRSTLNQNGGLAYARKNWLVNSLDYHDVERAPALANLNHDHHAFHPVLC